MTIFHGSSMNIEKSCTDGSAALLYIYDKHKVRFNVKNNCTQKVIYYARLKKLVLSKNKIELRYL